MSRRTVRLVGLVTAASGAGLVVAPSTGLALMGAGTAAPAPFLFRVVGMFMTLSGGLLLDGPDAPLALRWSVAQKTGAAGAMAAGVAVGVYRPRALAVAAFDGASAVLLLRALREARR